MVYGCDDSAPSSSLALFTDLYELTMAYGYWRAEMLEHEAVFDLFFRKHPFGGGFTVAAGLQAVLDTLQAFRFDASDIAYLAEQRDADGQPLFGGDFLAYLQRLRLRCDVDAVPEGTVVFPQEPLLRVRGPILQAQLLESALLNIVNFNSLIATKAARVCLAADGGAVVEFGMRRAQGLDGALSASRAAYVGGCASTSNVLAGKQYGIPVKGTHAHSWVMAFPSEARAFAAWADAMPNNCIFLVDTYDSMAGVDRAIEAGRRLRRAGHAMLGIRLDSGDIAALAIEARRRLDTAGFDKALIVASGDLDEHRIAALKARGAPVDLWGVGTRMVTGYDEPALGGVYKLSAVRAPGGPWEPKLKLSEERGKMTNPGLLQVRRYGAAGTMQADVIYDELQGFAAATQVVAAADRRQRFAVQPDWDSHDLLVPVVRGGQCVVELPTLAATRAYHLRQRAALPAAVLQLDAPAIYPVGLDPRLVDLRQRLSRRAAATGSE